MRVVLDGKTVVRERGGRHTRSRSKKCAAAGGVSTPVQEGRQTSEAGSAAYAPGAHILCTHHGTRGHAPQQRQCSTPASSCVASAATRSVRVTARRMTLCVSATARAGASTHLRYSHSSSPQQCLPRWPSTQQTRAGFPCLQ